MTRKIEQTRFTMYKALAALKAGGRWLMKKQNAEAFETALEEHLEEQRHLIERQRQAIADLYMSRRTLVSQVEQLSHELDVLKMANEAAGDLLRGKDISIGFRVTEDMRCEPGGFFNFAGHGGIAWLVKDQ